MPDEYYLGAGATIGRLRQYRRLRQKMLEENPYCEAKITCAGTNALAIGLHHKRGRGSYLLNKKYLVRTCQSCEDFIHKNNARAEKMGFLIRNNGKRWWLKGAKKPKV